MVLRSVVVFLKSLTLRGFKSFAERTVIEFQPGVTVIVGPNGSGKSNVVDALAWVFGTQGAKQLRGQKMEDVIFAGTPERPALGRAEVTITIDNSAGLIPVDAAELTISRLLFRSGESEYAINGVQCRLLDVQELLSDTGVGRQLHVLVGQGQIDSVLAAKPTDRRAVVEEAAGILKHRRRKERALRRLESMEANLHRLTDLSRELRRQIRPLERQAEAARHHAELASQVEVLQRFLAGRELAALQARAALAALARRELEEQRDHLRARRDQLEGSVVGGDEAVAELGRQLEAARDVEGRLRSMADRLSSLGHLARERARSAGLRIDSLADDPRGRLAAEKEQATTTEMEARRELESLQARRSQVESELARLEEKRRSLSAHEVGEVVARAAEIRAEMVALEEGKARADEEGDRLRARLTQVGEGVARREAERERLRTEIERLDASSMPLADDLARTEAARLSAADEVATLDDRRRQAESRAFRLRGDLEARRAAIEEARAGSPGRRAAAATTRSVGLMADLLVIESGAEAAVAAVLGSELEAVAVAGTAEETFSELKGAGATAAVVLDLATESEAASSGGDPAVDAPLLLSSVRAAPGPHAAAVEQLLRRRLGPVYLCAGWRAAWALAKRHPGCTFVTTDGDVVRSSGPVRLGGELVPPLLRTSALEELEAELRTVERRLHEASSLWERRRRERDTLVEEEAAVREALHQADAVLTNSAGSLARVEAELVELYDEELLLVAQLAELDRRHEQDAKRSQELAAELPALEEQEDAHQRQSGQVEATLAELRPAIEALSAERGALELRIGALGERAEAAAARRGAADRARAEAEALLQGREAAQAAAAGVREEAGRIAQQAAHAARVAEGLTEGATVDRGRVAEALGARTAQLEADRSTLRTTARELEMMGERLRRAELEEAEVRLRLETAEQARREIGSQEEVETTELPEGLSPEEVPIRLRHLRDDIARLGPVNPLALEELEAVSQRHEFLNAQLADVRASRRELEKVVGAVDARIIEIFTSAFDDVSRHFADIFGRLFPGGSGRLRLSDPADLLESGIEVEARPAGKRVDKLSLLSGGERALTALAFLFAVFRARPSPFYVLDEVEAALDDVNLHRFIGLLEEFRHEAQLLVVSHQKRTMESADSLYGVSMRDDGTTLVVSQRMSDIDALAASAR